MMRVKSVAFQSLCDGEVWRGGASSDINHVIDRGAKLRDFLEKLETRKVRKLVERSNLFEELDDYEFQRRFRLTKESVAELTLLIEDKLESKTTCNNVLNRVEQVLIALRFYAVAYMQLAIADLFNVSQPTVCRVVHRVSEAIASLLPDFIHQPVNIEECKKGKKETLEWCMKANLIASRYECSRCKKKYAFAKAKGNGYEWRCRNQSKDNRHDVVRSVRKGT
ncbi:nuclease HARBI1 [Trichonephila clavipes]|uniref:Nuclease HARBI1 n=1 Tax=Trichonephila clavipes TaxID=2585209 RepID=A0A8X6S5H0_TRICX|nr:nuclease HARBI1 [Trichonephila clavipes]